MSTATATEKVTITLPKAVVDIVRAKVSSGEYASESDFVEDVILGSALLSEPDSIGLEHWIATEGVRRYDAMKADPSRGLTSEQVFANLDIEPEDVHKAG
jgi:antitoxin ParD1/3/4